MTTDPPLHKRDYFKIYRRFNGVMNQAHAVNFNYIIRTGDVYEYTNSPDTLPNQTINLSKEDSFSSTIHQLIDDVTAEMQALPHIETLLTKEHWTITDREEWERTLAETTSKHVNTISAFDNYTLRSAGENRVHDLNDLSLDIEQGRPTHDITCETLSLIEGSINQQVENDILSRYRSLNEMSWKQPLSYFYAGGGKTNGPSDETIGSHAYIVTPAGNIIESTVDPDKHETSPYKKTLNDYSLEKLARGISALTEDQSVYGSFISKRDHRSTYAILDHGIPQISKNAIYSKDGNIAFDLVRNQNNEYEINLYQVIDRGSPHERLSFLAPMNINPSLDYWTEQRKKAGPTYNDRFNQTRFRLTIKGKDESYRIKAIYEDKIDSRHRKWKKISAINQPSRQEHKYNAYNENIVEICATREVEPTPNNLTQELRADKSATSAIKANHT